MFTEKPCSSKPLERTVVHTPMTTLSHTTPLALKKNGCLQFDWKSALFHLLAEKLCVNTLLLQFYSSYKICFKAFVERNVNMSYELNFSDVYQSVNYIVSLAKFTFIHLTL